MPKNNGSLPTETQNEKELEQLVSSNSLTSTHISNDVSPSHEGDFDALANLRKLVSEYYKTRNDTNIKLRKKYFNCSFALIFILVFGFIGTTIMVCLCVQNELATIISLVSSIGGLVPSVLILPRIIGEYLFPDNEYDPAPDVVELGKKSNKDKNDKKDE